MKFLLGKSWADLACGVVSQPLIHRGEWRDAVSAWAPLWVIYILNFREISLLHAWFTPDPWFSPNTVLSHTYTAGLSPRAAFQANLSLHYVCLWWTDLYLLFLRKRLFFFLIPQSNKQKVPKSHESEKKVFKIPFQTSCIRIIKGLFTVIFPRGLKISWETLWIEK